MLLTAAVCTIVQSCSSYKNENGMYKPSRQSGGSNTTSNNAPHVCPKYADPTNDWCFKHVFGEVLSEEGNQNDFTRDLLNSLLELQNDEKIVEIRLDNNYLSTGRKADRGFITDVHCIDNKKRKFIVEMQVKDHTGWEERIQGYVARDYGSQFEKGENYENISPIRLLAITKFKMFKDENEDIPYISHHKITEETTNKCVFNGMKWTIVELAKFNKGIDEINTQQDRWIFLLKNAKMLSEEEKKKLTDDVIIKSACERIDRTTWSHEDKIYYDRAEDRRKVENGSFAKERQEGRAEKEQEVKQRDNRRKKRKIEKEIANGLTPDTVKKIILSDYSDCDETDIENMINEIIEQRTNQ